MNRSRIVAALGAVLWVAACSAGGLGSPSATPSLPPTASPPPATAGGTVTFGVASSSFGDHLIGSENHALYLLTTDSANTSTCSGDCATTWPPAFIAQGQTPVGGSGVSATLGTMTRADGSMQVTVNGLPLYSYSGDAAPGDVKGQGKGGVWFLAGADGTALGAEAVTTPVPCACTEAPPQPSSPGSTDGYGDYGDY